MANGKVEGGGRDMWYHISASGGFGDTPQISVYFLEEEGDELDSDAAFSISLPEMISGCILDGAWGESNARHDKDDTMPFVYDSMIAYLEYLRQGLIAQRGLHILRNSSQQDEATDD
jgi:hypothetical protein